MAKSEIATSLDDYNYVIDVYTFVETDKICDVQTDLYREGFVTLNAAIKQLGILVNNYKKLYSPELLKEVWNDEEIQIVFKTYTYNNTITFQLSKTDNVL